MRRTLYVETSVISYLTSRPSRTILGAAYQQITREWWTREKDNYDLRISELVIRECSAGDAEAAKRRLLALHGIPMLEIDDRVRRVALGLVAAGCIPPHVAEDAMHIAVAAVHGVDYIVTWNFKHIANPTLQERVAIFLEAQGYLIPFICSPQELLGDNDDSTD